MPRRMAKVSTPAKEPREQVEWIVRLTTRLLALAVLLDAIVAVLVVDFAERGCRQDIVRVGDFDKLLARCFIATDSGSISVWFCSPFRADHNLRVLVRVVFLAERPVRALDILLRRGLVQPQDLVVVLCRQRNHREQQHRQCH